MIFLCVLFLISFRNIYHQFFFSGMKCHRRIDILSREYADICVQKENINPANKNLHLTRTSNKNLKFVPTLNKNFLWC